MRFVAARIILALGFVSMMMTDENYNRLRFANSARNYAALSLFLFIYSYIIFNYEGLMV